MNINGGLCCPIPVWAGRKERARGGEIWSKYTMYTWK
jgi:hypothetical protein